MSLASETESPIARASKSPRVLACLPCRQKKLRCDHGSPCANCIKSGSDCAPGSQAQRPRKRRFPERELLHRIRKYEHLLRQNHIPFEPMHSGESGIVRENRDVGIREASSPLSARFKSKNAWHTMSHGFREAGNDSDSSQDDVREDAIKNEWEKFIEDSDHLLFSLPRGTIDLMTIHPNAGQIFKLWQVYLDNVNPLLKVIHIPSLQGSIVEAASNTTNIEPNLEALMVGIYCVAVLSLTEEECNHHLGSAKRDMLLRFQLGCQQALWNCTFLRSDSRDCLTAFLLYLISVRPNTAPQSLSCMLGVAIRAARRMGIHSEAMLSKLSPFDAEMSRRLWWALVLFDARIGDIAGTRSNTLDPTWDCKIPLNVNDSELWKQMKEPPSGERGSGMCSEAIFIVVRSKLGDFVRHSALHLDFTHPVLKPLARSGNGGPAALENSVEQQYLKHCETENPLQAMTAASARSQLAKYLLLESQCRHSSSESYSDDDRDTETSYAIRFLEQDTLIMASSLTRGFKWLNCAYFPFPAYMQITQDLRRRPRQKQAGRAWESMNRNFDAWSSEFRGTGPFFRILSKLVMESWNAAKNAAGAGSLDREVPSIVQAIQHLQAGASSQPSEQDEKQPLANIDLTDVGGGQDSQPLDMFATPYSMDIENPSTTMRTDVFPTTLEPNLYLDWAAFGAWPGWSRA